MRTNEAEIAYFRRKDQSSKEYVMGMFSPSHKSATYKFTYLPVSASE